jgi:hypothetical protein
MSAREDMAFFFEKPLERIVELIVQQAAEAEVYERRVKVCIAYKLRLRVIVTNNRTSSWLVALVNQDISRQRCKMP